MTDETQQPPAETVSHEQGARDMLAMIGGLGPTDHMRREQLLWRLVSLHAGALTPVSENEKRGMERVLAILDRKIAEGGGSSDEDHNRYFRGRWAAFRECAIMLRSALDAEQLTKSHQPEGER